jgi:uncharacterized protein
MKQLPSRFRRLDGALADLPLEEPMLLTELDGFLTGVLLCPEPIAPAEWLQNVWGADDGGVPPFEDPLDVRWFADAVMARHNEIARDLRRGKPQPIFDTDERNGEIHWEGWVDGFGEAMALRPDSWAALEERDDLDVADALSRLSTLIAIARNESSLDSMEINAVHERAPETLIDSVVRLHASRLRAGEAKAPSAAPIGAGSDKVGRNDPCPCGSGKKFKRCCG